MEKFKQLDEIEKSDPRTHAFVIYDETLGDYRDKEISDVHKRLEEIQLEDYVPQEIRDHFITSKHLVLYSWYVYRFNAVADLHAVTSLEYALKIKSRKEGMGLARLIAHAVENGWIEDADFSIHRHKTKIRKEERQQIHGILGVELADTDNPIDGEYTSILSKSLPFLRNDYAHGSSTIGPSSYSKLTIVAEFINKIFMPDII